MQSQFRKKKNKPDYDASHVGLSVLSQEYKVIDKQKLFAVRDQEYYQSRVALESDKSEFQSQFLDQLAMWPSMSFSSFLSLSFASWLEIMKYKNI